MSTQLKLTLPDNSFERLESLMKQCGYESHAVTFSNALRLFEKVAKLHEEGYSFSITKNGKADRLDIFGPVEIEESIVSNENPLLRPSAEYHEEIRAVCDRLTPVIQEVAKTLGWAVAVHGSKVRDLDLIAVPWIRDASSVDDLLETVRQKVALEMSGECYLVNKEGEAKPNGRLAYTLIINSEETVHSPAGAHPFIDLSVVDVRIAS